MQEDVTFLTRVFHVNKIPSKKNKMNAVFLESILYEQIIEDYKN